MSTRTRQRLFAVLLVAVLATSLATVGWLLSSRSEQQTTLASVSAQLAERDEQVAVLEAETTEAAERARAVARLTETVEELQSELAEMKSQLADRDDTIEQLRAELAAAEDTTPAPAGPSPTTSTSPPTATDGGACHRLGAGFEELGEEGCASLERQMAECRTALASDPDYVEAPDIGLGLYEHVETGQIAGCDI